jgi:hypothetical protein
VPTLGLEQDAGAEKPACASGAQFHCAVSLTIPFVCTPCTVSSLFIDSPMFGRSVSSLDVVVQADRTRQLPMINKQHSALLMLASVGERLMANLSILKVRPSTIPTHLGLSLVFHNSGRYLFPLLPCHLIPSSVTDEAISIIGLTAPTITTLYGRTE